MTEKKVWLVTGAARGLGVDIVKAALTVGHAVIATGRDTAKVARAVGADKNLLVTTLDVIRPQDAQAAVAKAVETFGQIDVLVNNAGNFFAGFFEELSPEQVRDQIENASVRSDECDSCGPTGNAQAALRPGNHHFLDGWHRWSNVLHGVCGREVRRRGVDGVAHVGNRPIRNPYNAGRTWILPHRVTDQRFDDLR
jgi:NAD(P)-dependent dehydrogenase (short-subunit alcohol dehydrogenase family)